MRRYFVFSVVSLSLALYAISSSAVSVAFPVFTSEFNTTFVLAGWVLNSFQLVSTIIMPLAGKLSEVFGNKTSFIIYTVFFTIGSVFCAVSSNIYFLIGSRVIQGIGGGGIFPCAAGIVSDEFPETRQRFIGLFSSVIPIGMLIGPNLGGWMVETFGWRSTFWFVVPLGIIIIFLSIVLIPVDRKNNNKPSIDFIGAGLLFGSLSALMIGLTQISETNSKTQWITLTLIFALSIGLLIAFIRQEQRAKVPIIDIEVLVKKPFLASNVYNLLYGLTALGIFSLIPLYAVSVYKMGTLESGVILTPRSIGTIIASTITSIYLMKWGYRRPILAGTITMLLSLLLLSFQIKSVDAFGLHVGATPLLLVIMLFCGIGHGISTPASSNACIELMPQKVAIIMGVRGMFRQLGSVAGIAISTVLLNSIDSVEAFHLIMLISASILLLSIPIIFFMPSTPNGNTLISVKREKVKVPE